MEKVLDSNINKIYICLLKNIMEKKKWITPDINEINVEETKSGPAYGNTTEHPTYSS